MVINLNDTEIITKIKHENNILKDLNKPINKLNSLFLKSQEKVSYYYEDLKTGTVISFNPNKTFYAASTIKILVCIYLYEKSIKDKKILDVELKYTENNKKHESDIMENMDFGSKHKIRDLIKYTITASDNTAYVMLMEYVGKEKIKKYGLDLGATTTMEGNDYFGITNATDYAIYLKKLLSLVRDYEPAEDLLEYMKNTTINKINNSSVGENIIARKGGEWDIAYHDCAIIYDSNPFILLIFTQKGTMNDKDIFINKTAKQLYAIHSLIKSLKQTKTRNMM